MRVGVDTWRLLRHLDDDAEYARAQELCVGRGSMFPEKIAGHDVGLLGRVMWVDGHPCPGRLARVDELVDAEVELHRALDAEGLLLGSDGGCSRLDSTVDLATSDWEAGITLLSGLALVDVPRTRTGTEGRPPETVKWTGPSTRKIRARAYDKGLEAVEARRGQLIRLEAQVGYTKGARRTVSDLDPARDFKRRFEPMTKSADGLVAGALPVVSEKLAKRLEDGDLTPAAAERMAGWLLFGRTGAYKRSTSYNRRRELRSHGLVLADVLAGTVEVDVGEALDAALAAWAEQS